MHLRSAYCHVHVVLLNLYEDVQLVHGRPRPLLKGTKMAQFTPVADILDEAPYAGLPESQRPSGQSAAEVLLRAGDDDCVAVPVPMSMRNQLHALAEATGDVELAAAAAIEERRVPVGHFRQLPADTRVMIGVRVKFSDAEAEHLRSL